MFRRLLAMVFFGVLVAATALAQAPLPLLISTPLSRTLLVSLNAVQAQVDATLQRAAASQAFIAKPLAQQPVPLLPSTPIVRR
jgi:hypothetical protein